MLLSFKDTPRPRISNIEVTRLDRCNKILVWRLNGSTRATIGEQSLICRDETILAAVTEEDRSLLGCDIADSLAFLVETVRGSFNRIVRSRILYVLR